MVQRLLEVGRLDVLQQVQQTHADLIQLVDGLPPRPQDGEADVAVLVDVGVQDLVETLDLGRLEGVFLSGLEGEVDGGVPVEGPLLVGHDPDVQVGHSLIGVGDSHIVDRILTVLLDVDLHPLLDSLQVGVALALQLLLSGLTLLFEVFEHGKVNNIRRGTLIKFKACLLIYSDGHI